METVFQNHFDREHYQKPLVLTLLTVDEQFVFLLLKEFKIGMLLLAVHTGFGISQVQVILGDPATVSGGERKSKRQEKSGKEKVERK